MDKKKYRYFISGYVNYTNDKGICSGMFNTEVKREKKINSIEDIIEISKDYEKLQKLPSNSVIIISFHLFDE